VLGAGGLLFGSPNAIAAAEPEDPSPERSSSGRIVSDRFDWRTPGAPGTGNDHALDLEDRGGVDVGFRPRTAGDLTIDFDWRHRSGGSLAYAFNDEDSASRGFRAFTNSIADRGMWFRNPFGGSDVVYQGDLQDGRWHRIRVVLDAEANTYTAYVDGERVGLSYYHGDGWTAADRFRVMGRYSGTRTRVEYDRYVIADEAIHPEDSTDVRGTLVHYELEEGEGRTLTNGADRPGRIHPLVARKAALIESIRTDAGRILPEDEAEGLDRRAERLLERIDDGFDHADEEESSQYERALDRMVAAEEVTRTATESAVEPTHRIAIATVDLGISRAISRIAGRTLRVLGWGARRIASILSNIASTARRTLDAITGRVLLSASRRRELDLVLARLERRVDEYLEAFGPDLEELGKSLLKDSIKASVDYLPEDVRAALTRIREEFTGAIERIFYRSFQFDAESTVGALELGIPGVNVSVEDAMGTVADGVDSGSLQGEWSDERHAASERVREKIRRSEVTFLGGMGVLEDGADDIGLISLLAAVSALGFFAIGVFVGSTGAGFVVGSTIAALAVKLKTGAAALGKLSLALTVTISLVGTAFLTWTAKRHNDAIVEIAAPDPMVWTVSR
jgi:hypothetical protein